MPFEGTTEWIDPTSEQSRLVLDMMEFFFRDGAMWTKNTWQSRDGKCCLMGAVWFIRRQTGVDDDRVPEYLVRAIRPKFRRRRLKTIIDIISEFNDDCTTYSDIAAVICKAKALAEADAPAALGPPPELELAA